MQGTEHSGWPFLSCEWRCPSLVLLSHKWTKKTSALKATQLKQQKWVYMGEGKCKGGAVEVGSLYLLLLNHLKIEFAPFRSAFHQQCKLIEMWNTNLPWVCDPRKPFLLRLSKTSFYDYSISQEHLLSYGCSWDWARGWLEHYFTAVIHGLLKFSVAEQISEKKSMVYNYLAMKRQCSIKTTLLTFICTGALSYPNTKSKEKIFRENR